MSPIKHQHSRLTSMLEAVNTKLGQFAVKQYNLYHQARHDIGLERQHSTFSDYSEYDYITINSVGNAEFWRFDTRAADEMLYVLEIDDLVINGQHREFIEKIQLSLKDEAGAEKAKNIAIKEYTRQKLIKQLKELDNE